MWIGNIITQLFITSNSSYLQLFAVLAHVETEKNAVEALVQPVETVERLLHEMETLRSQVEDLECKLAVGVQGVKSPDEIQLQLDAELRKK